VIFCAVIPFGITFRRFHCTGVALDAVLVKRSQKLAPFYSSLDEPFIDEPEGNVLDAPPTAMTSIGTVFNDAFNAADSLHI
jgi:hypothetical protein